VTGIKVPSSFSLSPPLNKKMAPPIHEACERGDAVEVQQLLEEDEELVDAVDSEDRTPIFWACRSGHLSIVMILIVSYEVSVDEHCGDYQSPVEVAARYGQLHILQWMREERHIFELGRLLRQQVSFLSCKYGHLDVLRWLLSVQPSVANDFLPKHLGEAIHCGHFSLVQYVVEKYGPRVEVAHRSSVSTALHVACMWGKEELADWLIDHRYVGVEEQDPTHRCTPLHIACRGGYTHMVRHLVNDYKVNVHVVNAAGETPLHLAVKGDNDETAEYLMNECHADPLFENAEGNSALTMMCQSAKLFGMAKAHADRLQVSLVTPHLVELSYKRGEDDLYERLYPLRCVDPWTEASVLVQRDLTFHLDFMLRYELKNDQERYHQAKRSMLCTAIVYGDKPEFSKVIEILDTSATTFTGAEVNSVSDPSGIHHNDGETGLNALHLVSIRGDKDLLQILMGRKPCPDVNSRDGQGQTALHHAVVCAKSTVLSKWLIEQGGADVNAANADGVTPLFLASITGNLAVIQSAYMRSGANFDTADVRGDTPLHVACRAGHAHVVHQLLAYGASADVRNLAGDLPIDEARRSRNHAIIMTMFSGVRKPEMCLVCFERPREEIMITCGHFCVCDQCGAKLTACPVCRGESTKRRRVYM